MKIEFVTGKRKTGKSANMIEAMRKHIENGEICYFLVPEQNTLDSEHKIISTIGSKGLMDIQVVSFKKLGNILLKNTSLRSKTFLGEQGQILILNKIINDLEPELNYFKNVKASTLEEINRVIANLRDTNIDINEIDISNQSLSMKLIELDKIKKKYIEFLDNGFLDEVAFNNMLAEIINNSDLISNSHFFIDDFYNFSNQQLDIVKCIISSAKSATIALNIDKNDVNFNTIGRRILNDLIHFASENKIEKVVTDLDEQFYKSKEIEHLENILSHNKIIKYKDEVNNIKIRRLTNIDCEVKILFESIIRLYDQGYDYRQIKVICNNLDAYRNYFKLYRNIYDVPIFIDEKVSINTHPITRLILSMIKLVDDIKTQDILMLLKSGYLEFEDSEIESLEKYVKENGVNYNKWLNIFKESEIESIRLRVIDLIGYVRKNFTGRNIREKINSLYKIITDYKIYDKLSGKIEVFKNIENYKNVYINTQYWNKFLESLDQMVSFLGEKVISNKEFHDLLCNSLEREHISILPINGNEVIVINSQDSFKESAEILFIIGANEGYLPEKISQEALFPLAEAQIIEEYFNWKKDDLSKQNIRNMELYFSLTLASERLFISYSLNDIKGDAIKPAYILKNIEKSFGEGVLEELEDLNYKYYYSKGISLINLIKQSKGGLIETNKSEIDNVFKEFSGFLNKFFEYNNLELNEGKVNDQVVEKIIFNNLEPKFSISKFEEYGKCPYSYFVKYAIGPEEEREYDVKVMDIGNIYHHILEKIGKLNWFLENSEELDDAIAEQFEKEYIEKDLYKYDSNQLKYRLGKIAEVGKDIIKDLRNDIMNSQFKPHFYEVEFGPDKIFPEYRLEIDNGKSFYIEGKVDRVDLFKELGIEYLRIIDYKLKGKKIDYRKLRDGLSYQLFIYLNALTKSKFTPNGVIYNKLLEEEGKSRLSGLIINSEEANLIIPEGISRNNIVNLDGYTLISRYMDEKVIENAQKIFNGDFKVNPYYYKNDERGCTYCKYNNICKNKKENRYLDSNKYDKDMFVEELRKKYAKLDK